MTAQEWTHYYFAIGCALSALVTAAERRGRGWYHYSSGELIVASEVVL